MQRVELSEIVLLSCLPITGNINKAIDGLIFQVAENKKMIVSSAEVASKATQLEQTISNLESAMSEEKESKVQIVQGWVWRKSLSISVIGTEFACIMQVISLFFYKVTYSKI